MLVPSIAQLPTLSSARNVCQRFRFMTSATTSDRQAITIRSTLLWVGTVAVLWLVVAIARGGTTLHLGPLLVPIIPLLVARKESFAMRATWIAGLAGLVVVATLWITGSLDGPALSPFPDALAESLAFVGAGTALGLIGSSISRSE